MCILKVLFKIKIKRKNFKRNKVLLIEKKKRNIMVNLLKISQMFSTINNNEFSSDKRGFIRSQECNHRSDFVSFADSTDRIFGTVRFPELYVNKNLYN